MADLIVVTGPPGAGKSTVARILAQRFDPCALVAGDDFFQMVTRGRIDPWTDGAQHQNEVVVAAAAAAAGRLVAGGYTVIYDGVITPGFLDPFVIATGLSELLYVVLLPAVEECVERVRARSDHGFSDLAATRRMYRDFAGAGIADRHVLSGNPAAAEVAADVVHRIADGSLLWSGGRSRAKPDEQPVMAAARRNQKGPDQPTWASPM